MSTVSRIRHSCNLSGVFSWPSFIESEQAFESEYCDCDCVGDNVGGFVWYNVEKNRSVLMWDKGECNPVAWVSCRERAETGIRWIQDKCD